MEKITPTQHPFLRTRIVSGGIFIALAPLVFFSAGVFASLQNDIRIQESMAAVDSGLHADQLYLLAQSNELNERETFDRHLESEELAELLSAAIAEKDRRSLDELLIIGENGAVVTRTRAVQQRGDFILHSTLWGREVLNGNDVASIEAGIAFPLVVQGAVPMERGGQFFGSIASAYIIDDVYAVRSQQKWLPQGTHIAFYVPDNGIIADSFKSGEYSQILAFYFTDGVNSPGSTPIRVAIKGEQYLVYSVALKGVADSSGQILIFIPSGTLFMQIAAGVSCVLLLLGVALLLWLLANRKYFLLFWFVAISLCGLGGASAFLLYGDYAAKSVISLSRPLYTIYNSTLELDPASATLTKQFEYRVGIKLQSGGEAINATEVLLTYNPQKVQVTEIDFSRSFCNKSLILQRDIDNEAGRVHIVCGVPNPGFSERVGIIADLFLQPTEEGTFTLKFAPETKVLANDGLGTEVLRYALDGSYVIAKQFDTQETHQTQTLVFSPTHQNQERWYSKRDVLLMWTKQNDSTFRYSFDNSIDDGFAGATSVVGDMLKITMPSNGIYYFTLENSNSAGIQRVDYKFMIDSEPPLPPMVKVSTNRPNIGELIRFEFTGSDALSGLQPNFYIKFDDGIFFPIGDTFVTAFYEPGRHTLTVRTFDLANNYSDTSISVVVQSQMQASLGSLLR